MLFDNLPDAPVWHALYFQPKLLPLLGRLVVLMGDLRRSNDYAYAHLAGSTYSGYVRTTVHPAPGCQGDCWDGVS